MNKEDNVQSLTVTSSPASSASKYFFGMICDDHFISDIEMTLSEFFRYHQNGRFIEVQARLLTVNYAGN